MEQQQIISKQLITTCNKYKTEYTQVAEKNEGDGSEFEQILIDIDIKE
jgi:hypothetical protein